ncbi:acetyl-CoA carboxylase biotin carboxyl carrier protein subunit [Candidatus Binatia bacterium]|nr:acetyl-CoA carboxylase biotin carboxyl carrier protein subunit [Candidatus Binatia bacterium]
MPAIPLVFTIAPPQPVYSIDGGVYSFVPESPSHTTHAVGSFAAPEVVAPMPGKILHVLVNAGDRVEAGDGLVILEAMKIETRLNAEAAGSVAEVRVAAGDTVDGGQVLVVMQFDS